VGGRDTGWATDFTLDCSERIVGRPQITTASQTTAATFESTTHNSPSMIVIGHDFFLLDETQSQFDTFRVSLRGHRTASGIQEHPSSERAHVSAGADFAKLNIEPVHSTKR
jgi:hypothetical protein